MVLDARFEPCNRAARHRDATADAAAPVPIATRSNFFIIVFLYVKPSAALEEAHVESGRCVRGADYRCARRIQLFRKRSEEHTSELQSHLNLVSRLLLEKKKQ